MDNVLVRRVGKAKRAHHRSATRRAMVGTAQARLCLPYESSSDSADACAGGTGIGNFSYCFGKFTGR
jgi:hypothetical protein